MPAASSLLPWFAPRLSRPMIGVLNNLGHEMHYTRGEVLYESPGFFRPLMLVRRGIVEWIHYTRTRSLYRLVDRGLFAEVVKHFMYKIEWCVGIGA